MPLEYLMWVKEIDGKPLLINNVDELKQNLPNVSFPTVVSDELIIWHGLYRVTSEPPPDYDCSESRIVNKLYKQNGQYVRGWDIVGLTDVEKAQNKQAKIDAIQREANLRLQNTDWSELPSVSDMSQPVHLLNTHDFLNYRTAIRQIIATKPDTVTTWPTIPKAEWFKEEVTK